MKKTLLIILLSALVLSSCNLIKSGDSETSAVVTEAQTKQMQESSIDVFDAAQKIVDKANFDIALDRIDEANVPYISGYASLPEGTRCAVYMAAGANAEEVAVFASDDTTAVTNAIKNHIQLQSEAFSSYKPDDVPKLENAIIYSKNDIVVLVVTGDTALAKSVVGEVIG